MLKSFNLATKNINQRYSYLTLLEYNGSRKQARFLDSEYGEFYGIFNYVLTGSKSHKQRANAKSRHKFKDVSLRLNERHTHLTLLTYNGSKNDASFHDIKYGKFIANYKSVYMGKSQHPERTKCLKKIASNLSSTREKTKETNLQKYGVENVSQNEDIKGKKYNTCFQKYGVNNFSQTKSFISKMQKNGSFKSIDGYTLKEYYLINNCLGAYSTAVHNLRKGGVDLVLNQKNNTSSLELIVLKMLDGLNISFKHNKKISIYRPDFIVDNLIIECDGLYWHSDANQVDNKYHFNKLNFYSSLNYKSLFFREDEILNKLPIIESIILAKLGKISERVFARKCKFEMLDTKTSAKFFEDNHLMGKGTGKTFALTYQGEVVSAMRVVNNKDHIEISRFCNRLNTYVLGGFSKLMKQALLATGKKKVISFVDMRYGDGHSLQKLGFEEKSNHVSFKWTNKQKTFHRMSFRGNTGYKCSLFKIWDCGQKKFELILTSRS